MAGENDALKFDIGTALGDANLGVTEEEMRKLNFQNTGKLALSDAMAYLSFDVETFNKYCRPILANCSSFKDIVSSSVYVEIEGEKARIFATDAVSFTEVLIPAKANKFKSEIIFNFSSVFHVSRTQVKDQVLILEGDKLYADFYGGKIFIPTYTIDKKTFKAVPGKAKFEGVYDVKKLLAAFETAAPVLQTNMIPELTYLFFTKDGAFVTNGSQTAKIDGAFPECAIRQKDMAVIKTLLSNVSTEIVNVSIYDKFIGIITDTFKYYIPFIDKKLLTVQMEINKPVTGFSVDTGFFSELVSVMASMPDNVGTADLIFEKAQLSMKFLTRRGDVSTLIVSTANIGDVVPTTLNVSLKQLLVFGKVFRLDGMVTVGSSGKSLSFYTNDKVVVLNNK